MPSSHKDMQMRFACMDQVHSCWGGKLLRENDAPPKNAVKLVRVPIVQASEIVKKILAAGVRGRGYCSRILYARQFSS